MRKRIRETKLWLRLKKFLYIKKLREKNSSTITLCEVSNVLTEIGHVSLIVVVAFYLDAGGSSGGGGICSCLFCIMKSISKIILSLLEPRV